MSPSLAAGESAVAALSRRAFAARVLHLGVGALKPVRRGASVTVPAVVGATVLAACSVERRWPSGVSFGDDFPPLATTTLRGEPATFGRIWSDSSLADMEGLWMLDPITRSGWPGTLDIGCGGPQEGHTWDSAAAGSMDTLWRGQMAALDSKWGSLAEVHLSMAHEMNGDWYEWSVRPGQEVPFTAAWQRFYDIVQTQLVSKGRNAKVTLNYNAESLNGLPPDAYWPGDLYVDLIGVNCYDGLGDHEATLPGWVDFAAARQKHISVPEWGLYPLEDRHVDNPAFIARMNDFFRSHSEITAGEAYFNSRNSTLNSAVPEARDQYRSLSWGA